MSKLSSKIKKLEREASLLRFAQKLGKDVETNGSKIRKIERQLFHLRKETERE